MSAQRGEAGLEEGASPGEKWSPKVNSFGLLARGLSPVQGKGGRVTPAVTWDRRGEIQGAARLHGRDGRTQPQMLPMATPQGEGSGQEGWGEGRGAS